MNAPPDIPSARLTERLAELRTAVDPLGLDGLLVFGSANIRYLTGFSGSSGLLLVPRDARATLITDFRYEEQAGGEVPSEIRVRIAEAGLIQELGRRLEEGPSPIQLGYSATELTVWDRNELKERCNGATWEEAPPLVARMRRRKTPDEVALIRRAIDIAEAAFLRTIARLAEGMSELELAATLEFELRNGGSGRLPFDTIVASGPRSSLPHAAPSDRKLVEGDLVLFDFGASASGYVSDITRTIALGQPADWQIELQEAVAEAQTAAIEAIGPGVRAADVDAAARTVLGDRGLASRFGHSTGHGIGLEVHEGPRLARRSEDTLEPGHVVTVEPGVYLPAQGGIRIEDDVLVDPDGSVILSGLDRSLERI